MAAALGAIQWDDSPRSAHKEHHFYRGCAICSGDIEQIADAMREPIARALFDQTYGGQRWTWEDAGLGVGGPEMHCAYRAQADRILSQDVPTCDFDGCTLPAVEPVVFLNPNISHPERGFYWGCAAHARQLVSGPPMR